MGNYYCVKCKRRTVTLNPKQKLTKNNRVFIYGTCAECRKKKSTFVGSGLVNQLLNSEKLPEVHLPSYSYCGPGTKLKKRLLRGDKGKNELDKACMSHDMHYAIFKDTKDRHVFDKQLQDKAFQVAKESKNIKTKLDAGLVGSVMYGKRKLGLGNKI